MHYEKSINPDRNRSIKIIKDRLKFERAPTFFKKKNLRKNTQFSIQLIICEWIIAAITFFEIG